jgi:starvation-inducible outer membrane lipoprotein
MKKILYIFIILATFILFQGCITIPEDSDQPWNSRQDWEGAPSVPGMNGN